jgi:hypothetical protein
VAHSGQEVTETLVFEGPQASSDASTAFKTTLTWTAVP